MKTGMNLESHEGKGKVKGQKGYFTKILEDQLRRTGSDLRKRIFGRDPLMPEPQYK